MGKGKKGLRGGGGGGGAGSVVKPTKFFFKKTFLLGNSLLGSLVFTRYWEPSKKKFLFLLGFRT